MTVAWGKISAGEVLDGIDGTWISGNRQTTLTGISTDSRTLAEGDLFLPLNGDRYEGHDFIPEAIQHGAAGIVVQNDWLNSKYRDEYPDPFAFEFRDSQSVIRRPSVIAVEDTLKALGDLAGWWRRQHNVKVVAVTGSSGKTTTKEMTANILGPENRTLKTQGNFNNLVGLPLTLMRLSPGHQKAVLEMGMNHPGEIARLTEIADPNIGVITNIGMAHLEGVGDIDGVVRAKVELIEKISPKGRVVINGDDGRLLRAASVFQKDMTTFGLGRENDVRAHRILDSGRKGVSFDLQYQDKAWPVELKVPGLQNIFNALAAAAAVLCLNEPAERIVEGLARFKGVKGRFMVNFLPGNIILVDDTYNANPLSLKATLESAGLMIDEGSRIIMGLGEMMEMGDEVIPAHEEAGRMVAGSRVDYFLAMGEHARDMVKGAVESGMSPACAGIVESHDEMTRKISQEIREGDLIIVKGSRKMAMENVVDDLQSAFGGVKEP